MSWYEITHSCGHTRRNRVSGDNTEHRDARARDLAGQDCADCYAATRRLQDDAALAAATDRAAAEGWPTLDGSAEQVARAQLLRAKAIERLEIFAEIAEADRTNPEASVKTTARILALVAAARPVLLRQVSAREWITSGDLVVAPNELFFRWASTEEQGEFATDPARAMRFNRIIDRAKLIAVQR